MNVENEDIRDRDEALAQASGEDAGQEFPQGGDQKPSSDDDQSGGKERDNIAILEKRLRDTQASFHKIAQEKSELVKKLFELEAKLAQMSEKQWEPERDPFDFLEDEKFDEKFLAEPREALKRVLVGLGEVLQGLDARYRREIEQLWRELRRPDAKVQSIMSKLVEEHPDLRDVPEDYLMVFAKVLATKDSSGASDGKREWPGGSIPSRRGQAPASGKSLSPEAKKFFDLIYG